MPNVMSSLRQHCLAQKYLPTTNHRPNKAYLGNDDIDNGENVIPDPSRRRWILGEISEDKLVEFAAHLKFDSEKLEDFKARRRSVRLGQTQTLLPPYVSSLLVSIPSCWHRLVVDPHRAGIA